MSSEPTLWYKQTGNTTTLVGMECESCERKFFPSRVTCPSCRSKEIKMIDLPELGNLVTWTVTKVLPENHEEKQAILGLVDFGGALVLAKIKDVNEKELKQNYHLLVKLQSTKMEPKGLIQSFHFIPVEKSTEDIVE